ncbi:specifically androgen-regulated gene protein [Betta splendens]|uniref:Specifically androgen-regulated gene protein n=1 Tax=Betta splendens TaxID=158456 RepID=A0A6P7MIP1_BETSP|nr:specifically androgen-regulated gene protein [Betta splendens]XP_055364978.1 specifically androgen-regulated gene protein [Betta splendens]XP_055364979.1 specifically androgen-regulated gene protein [Betta splendens]
MPGSDTWPGGTGLDTTPGMDSAGSCDSVVSANSGFSDDSLGHLSAEEKACLMFLEETIESLDTEEDSGLSNDEPDQLPGPGNVATKLADLSASMSNNKLNGSGKPVSTEPLKKDVDAKPIQSYLVPTPLVLASSPPHSLPSKPGNPTDKNLCSKAQFTPSSNKSCVAPPLPLEVNVVMPPPVKPKDNSFRTTEVPLPRGPLSYDALVHLRRSASAKKTPLCPTVDHTIEQHKLLPATKEDHSVGKLPRSDRSHLDVSKPKAGPPAVAPKPKRIPVHVSVKALNEASVITPDLSDSVRDAPGPQVVRQEALQKLGLLQQDEMENKMVDSASPPKTHFSNPMPDRFTRGPPNVYPSRSPSFCYSQVPTEPKNRCLQSSSSFHQYSSHDHQPASVQPPPQVNGLKAAGVDPSAQTDNHHQHPNRRVSPAGPTKSATAQPAAHKASNTVPYTVMVVPGMGADRKEALRKLGLLKQ